ncbi:hypothetical protein FH972_021631 [Carpinus fangiana]|uniref:Uncharacterized protein n=1 Tax=Carpinus fangiana TaxID=176857 RepID=A0A5N6KPU6_9ROSI|nr:hypothetical protein FH972_021631 [Carpinus fangiana]
MVQWGKLFGASHHHERSSGERNALLPTRRNDASSAISSTEVTKVALRLKHQVETVIPCEIDEDRVTTPLSGVITAAVVETSKQAGGSEHKSCVVYCLLICKKWFKKQSLLEPWDADLHLVRATACEVIAKRIIEGEEDMDYLLEHVLLKRFSILIDGDDSPAANAVETAVDLHALTVIGSSGYQKCIQYLWRGWLVQDDCDTSRFVPYEDKTNTSYWAHLDPDRMRVPKYQNALQIIFSVIFLGLYTGAINTVNPTGDIDPVEALLYIFTLGFICDEFSKFWKVGRFYLGFWNMFNFTLYILLTTSFVTRMIALGHPEDNHQRKNFNNLSYNFLAFTAPMFWMRLMLYFDTFRFFGAMLVVVKIMMKESLIFFALLGFVIIGFFQAFIGMDLVDSDLDATSFIFQAMANTVMSSPDFDGFDNFAPPFGIILYYIFTFVVMVILLNVLVALYNSAYSDITENAIDEYMALFAQKCLQFVRAPDENVFIAPLNLVELFCLVLPFEWWMAKPTYERLNDIVMGVLYSPLLVVTAFLEQRSAWVIKDNRRRGEEDEDTIEEWEQLDWKPHNEDDKWVKMVKETSPDIKMDFTTKEVLKLKDEVAEMKEMLAKLLER